MRSESHPMSLRWVAPPDLRLWEPNRDRPYPATLEEGEPSQEPGWAWREGPARHPFDPSDRRGIVRPRDLGGPHDIRS
jgi:hypothetical protein